MINPWKVPFVQNQSVQPNYMKTEYTLLIKNTSLDETQKKPMLLKREITKLVLNVKLLKTIFSKYGILFLTLEDEESRDKIKTN